VCERDSNRKILKEIETFRYFESNTDRDKHRSRDTETITERYYERESLIEFVCVIPRKRLIEASTDNLRLE